MLSAGHYRSTEKGYKYFCLVSENLYFHVKSICGNVFDHLSPERVGPWQTLGLV